MALFKRKRSSRADEKQDGDAAAGAGEKKKVVWHKRPANTAFKQQRLKAWQPILTPGTVIPSLLVIAVVFAPLGGILYWGSTLVQQFELDYTQCEFTAPNDTFEAVPQSAYDFKLGGNHPVTAPSWRFNRDESAPVGRQSACSIQFTLPQDTTLQAPVFMYYKLTNFYQNHRRYVMSYNQDQLLGNAPSYSSVQGGDCEPLDVRDGKIIYPCGLIANSVFNDTFTQPVLVNPAGQLGNVTYNMTDTGIAWPGERSKYQPTSYALSEIVPPPFWLARFPDGYTDTNPPPDLGTDEHFINWMRTAGLPTFRKLYFRNDNEDLTGGQYEIVAYMNYAVAPYGGTKSLLFSTTSFIGGKNPVMGIAYLAVAGASIVLALGLLARHVIKPRKLGDMRFLSWNMPKKHDAGANAPGLAQPFAK